MEMTQQEGLSDYLINKLLNPNSEFSGITHVVVFDALPVDITNELTNLAIADLAQYVRGVAKPEVSGKIVNANFTTGNLSQTSIYAVAVISQGSQNVGNQDNWPPAEPGIISWFRKLDDEVSTLTIEDGIPISIELKSGF